MVRSQINYLLLVCLCVNGTLTSIADNTFLCEEPPNLTDKLTDALSAFYTDPAFTSQMSSLMTQQAYPTLVTSSESLVLETSRGVNDTTCPWRWTLNFDPYRVPENIAEAVCNCEHCGQTSSISGCPGNGGTSARCRPVHGPIVVIRRMCEPESGDSVYRYRAELQNVAVGCTCVNPILI